MSKSQSREVRLPKSDIVPVGDEKIVRIESLLKELHTSQEITVGNLWKMVYYVDDNVQFKDHINAIVSKFKSAIELCPIITKEMLKNDAGLVRRILERIQILRAKCSAVRVKFIGTANRDELEKILPGFGNDEKITFSE